MLYLLSFGWPWFAAAGALGLAVGFSATTSGKPASGRWIWPLALLLVVAAEIAVSQGYPAGRLGLQIEIAALAAIAYLAGLPVGGVARRPLLAQTALAAKPTPVVLRGRAAPATPKPVAPPERQVAPAKQQVAPAKQEAPAPIKALASLVASAPRAEPEPAAPGKKKHPGKRPESLAKARDGGPDDLTRIKGVGPKSVEKLHALGVYHFDQIAAWTLDEAKWIGAELSVPGKVERGKWILQARELMQPKDGHPEPSQEPSSDA